MRFPEFPLQPSRKCLLAVAFAGVAATAAGFAFKPSPAKTAASSLPSDFAKKARTVQLPAVTLDIAAAVTANSVEAEFQGNGRDKLHADLTNATKRVMTLHFSAGQLFENGKSSVTLLRSEDVELQPGEKKTAAFATAATSAQNRMADAEYALATGRFPKLDPLFGYLREHAEISSAAIQTAVLALTENLPLRSFAKFTIVGGDLPSPLDASAFKVEVVDIVTALSVLREIGIPSERLALSIDPQLKIEAMIDPLAHAFAMRYYGIATENEWAFWKNELTGGNPSTRHYALYGIGRFFPEIALEMMPKWVREARTHPAFRVSAVQALAETQRPEALTILRQLESELNPASEVGKAAKLAASYLDARLGKTVANKVAVAFRVSQDAAGM